jgi:hypothetical protein
MTEITVEVRDVYGVEKYYPLCDLAKSFARIANTTTLTPTALHIIRGMGYTINFKVKEREFV